MGSGEGANRIEYRFEPLTKIRQNILGNLAVRLIDLQRTEIWRMITFSKMQDE